MEVDGKVPSAQGQQTSIGPAGRRDPRHQNARAPGVDIRLACSHPLTFCENTGTLCRGRSQQAIEVFSDFTFMKAKVTVSFTNPDDTG